MALEFDCPYCKATIRVPDQAAGKRGRCPQCAARINVPKLGQTRRAGDAQPFFPGSPVPDAEVTAPKAADDDLVFQEYDPQQEIAIDPNLEAELPPGDIAIPDLAAAAPRSFPQPVRQMPDTVLSRNARKKGGGWVWMVVTVLLLGGGGAAGIVYLISSQKGLTGELEGKIVENAQMPARTISATVFDLPAAETGKILDRLDRSPVPLVSTLASVQLQGSDDGLRVIVAPGSASSLYRVEISRNAELVKFREDHTKQYEAVRFEDLSLAANQLFRTVKKVQAKQGAAHDLAAYRDSVGFTATVRGLGYFVIAVHRKQVYQCVYEDDDALYFLLPAGAKEFRIQGKPRKKIEEFFPGDFLVKVTGTIRLKDEEASAEPPADTKKKASDEEMQEDDSEPEMSEEKSR